MTIYDENGNPIEIPDNQAPPGMGQGDKANLYHYIANKYNLLSPDKYGEAREKAKEEANAKKSNLIWAQLGSGIGEAMAGRSPEKTGEVFKGLRGEVDASTIGEVDARRKAQGEILGQNLTMSKMLKENEGFDPNSNKSQSFRKMIEANFPEIPKVYGDMWGDVTAGDAELVYKPLQLGENIKARRERNTILSGKEELKSKRPLQEKPNAGQTTLDREFAKDYNQWTSGGEATVLKNLEKLKAAQEILQKRSKEPVEFTSGRLIGNLPKWLRTEESKTLEQDVRSTAQSTLKEILGSVFTEKEGERIMAYAYDPSLSPEANANKVNAAIKELESLYMNKKAKADYFGTNNETLKGYNPSQKTSTSKTVVSKQYSPARNKTKVTYSDGTVEIKDGK